MAEGSDVWARITMGRDNYGKATRLVSAIC